MIYHHHIAVTLQRGCSKLHWKCHYVFSALLLRRKRRVCYFMKERTFWQRKISVKGVLA